MELNGIGGGRGFPLEEAGIGWPCWDGLALLADRCSRPLDNSSQLCPSLKWQVTSYNEIKSMLEPHPGAPRGIKGENKQVLRWALVTEERVPALTRTTLRGNSRAAGEGHAWQGAHWDYRKAAAPEIPALGAALARGRDRREASEIFTRQEGGPRDGIPGWKEQTALTSRRRHQPHSRHCHPKACH